MTKTLDAVGIALAVLMSAAWLLLAFDLYGVLSSGPPGSGEDRYSRAWELLWAYALACAVWVCLGLVFYRLHLPSGLWVYLLGAAATISAFNLMEMGQPRWPAVFPLLLPWLLLAAALSGGHWPAFRTPLMIASAIPCVLAVAAFASSTLHSRSARNAVQSEIRQRNLAAVATIGEDQPLWTWLPLLEEESGVREETLAALRKLTRRQSDVEAMLANDRLAARELLPLLDLQPTERLRQQVTAWCVKTADYARTKPGGGDEILEGTFMFGPLPALRWMHARGGDCRECVSQLKAAALDYQDTKVRARYIKELDALSK
jgi:hypothetical protein